MQERVNSAGLNCSNSAHFQSLQHWTLAWLLGNDLWALRVSYLIRVLFVCLRLWTMTVYTSICFCMHEPLGHTISVWLWRLGFEQLAEVSHVDAAWLMQSTWMSFKKNRGYQGYGGLLCFAILLWLHIVAGRTNCYETPLGEESRKLFPDLS